MRDVRGSVLPRNWESLLAIAALLTPAALGCGGERRSEAGSVDTAAVSSSDTTATQVGDTAPAAIPDSTADGRRDATPAENPSARKDSVTKKSSRAPGPGSPAPSAQRPATPKPTPQAAPDTATAAAPQPADTPRATAAQPSEGNAPLRDPYHQAPLDTVSQVVYDGWKQFNLNCARCHGEDVLGTTIAPHLILSLKPDGPINTKELFVQTVCAGRPEKGMPSWCALGMDMDKINQIYQYVKGRSEGKIHPGRPAVRSG